MNTDDTPAFVDLLELWFEEKYKSFIRIARWNGNEKKPELEIVIRVPNIAHAYTKYDHIPIGSVSPNNDVTIMTYGKKHFNLPTLEQETKNAADPDFFPWFERTVRHHHYYEISKIESLL